ncbi:MobF family relaxase [Dactylosporangium sp. NPDC051485]|uniref:MobF family relaxase n=1 Tax=Dactylosporangium sp. NPDC051485 TaxID=3154846 RepID=UPI00341B6390
MLTVTKIAPGAGIKYLTGQVAAGGHDFRPAPSSGAAAYFADATAHGEAPGWWAAQSTALFGVSGEVTEQQLLNLIGKGAHPDTGVPLGKLWRIYQPMTDERRADAYQRALAKLPADATVEQKAKLWNDIHTQPERRAVAGYDVTVSMKKSGSLLWAFGDDNVKAAVMAAQHAGVRAVLEHLRVHGAYTRVGTNGLVQLDTDGLAAAVYDHRLSRAKDPQLHSHIVISSKVRIVDSEGREKWLALDGRALYQATIGARIAYERAVEVELNRRLGVRFAARDDSPIREVVGISIASIRQYSKRRAAIVADLRAGQPTAGAVPTSRWRRIAQVATLRTRPAKDAAESTREMHQRLLREDAAAGLTTAADVRRIVTGRVQDHVHQLAARALTDARRHATDPARLDETDLHTALDRLGIDSDDTRNAAVNAAVRLDDHLAVERAVANLAGERAVFKIDHLELHIGRVLGANPNATTREDWARVQRLTARAVSERAGGLRVLTPPALVQWGPDLIRASDREGVYTRHRDLHLSTRSVLAAEHTVIAAATERGATTATAELLDTIATELDLSDDKHTALHHILGDDRRVTGVIGPAGSGKTRLQRAVAVAAHRAGIPVLGLAVSQNAADILADATTHPDTPPMRTENVAMWLHGQHTPPAGTTTATHWSFAPGQWVIVDEASQASSTQLAELVRLLAAVGGKLILVGDPEQISAVGPGGLLRHLAGLGATAELVEARRFADPWEGPASLRLRDGDTTVLTEYDRRHRITAGHRDDLVTAMLTGWTDDILAGRDSIMLVETQAEAADLAAQARAQLIRAGVVQAGRSVGLADDNRASIGDLIVTRQNDRRLTTDDGFVANRDTWRILDIGPGGDLDVLNTRTDTTVILPAEYAAQHVQLAYASTVDAAQGRTVDVARGLVDEATTRARLYVMATRGALSNLLYVITSHRVEEAHHHQQPGAGIALIADILRADTTDRSATETEQRLAADNDALHRWGPIFDDLLGRAGVHAHARTVAAATIRHHRADTGAADTAIASSRIAAQLLKDPALPALTYQLGRLATAGYDTGQVLDAAVSWRELDTAHDVAAVLTWRIEQLYAGALADGAVAVRAEHTSTYTDRVPAEAIGALADTIAEVAAICDRRITGLVELAADHQPDWSRVLGPVPDDPDGRAAWTAAAAVVIAYRDRFPVPRGEAIGPEPSRRDPARWAAWHRAQIAVGVATVAGQVRAASDPQLRQYIAAQRVADTAAPAYVGDDLRAAHLQLAAAQHIISDARTALAAAESTAERLRTAAAPRTTWWRRPTAVNTRNAELAAAQRRADIRVQRLTDQMRLPEITVDRLTTTVRDLETRHADWTANYQRTLPTRYLGLAAAQEQARRAQQANRNAEKLLNAVKATTAKVRAVDDTRPKPHTTPVPPRAADLAEAGRDRTAITLDSRDRDADQDLDL